MTYSTRRTFVNVTAATALAAIGLPRKLGASEVPAGVMDAGSLSSFSEDDAYDKYRQQGFFVVRRERKLFALSSVCTHKGCKLRVKDDLSFICKCHGSTFDKDGHVTKGPAKRDLPRLAVRLDEAGHVLVDLNQAIT